jgi:transposase
MIRDQFWLTDALFSKIERHLPTDTRGKARVDDRRVISGIVHVLKSGSRWVDAPPDYGPKKTLYNRFVRWAEKGVWTNLFQALVQAGGPSGQVLGSDRQFRGESPSLGGWRKRGEKNQAIGRSRGGRTTKIHALTDAQCRPLAFMLTGGQVADCTAAGAVLDRLPDCDVLHATKATTSTRSVDRSKNAARCRTSRPRPIANGSPASRHSSTETETRSSGCFAG